MSIIRSDGGYGLSDGERLASQLGLEFEPRDNAAFQMLVGDVKRVRQQVNNLDLLTDQDVLDLIAENTLSQSDVLTLITNNALQPADITAGTGISIAAGADSVQISSTVTTFNSSPFSATSGLIGFLAAGDHTFSLSVRYDPDGWVSGGNLVAPKTGVVFLSCYCTVSRGFEANDIGDSLNLVKSGVVINTQSLFGQRIKTFEGEVRTSVTIETIPFSYVLQVTAGDTFSLVFATAAAAGTSTNVLTDISGFYLST